MKYNLYLNKYNVNSRILPIFKSPILQEKMKKIKINLN